MVEIRPSASYFARAAWGRTVAVVTLAAFAVVLAVSGSTYGLLLIVAIVASEFLLALAFMSSRLVVDAKSMSYRNSFGRVRMWSREQVRAFSYDRPMMGFFGRPRRAVFEDEQGRPLLALDEGLWAPYDVVQITELWGIPVSEWQEPPPRGLFGHLWRLLLATAALCLLVGGSVMVVIAIVMARHQ
jgi:hypothetical protein